MSTVADEITAPTAAPEAGDPGDPRTRVPRATVLLLAASCGAVVANIYYAQPLLDTIAHAFHVSPGTAGLLVTATQLGYLAGLVFLVPLGDLVQRRRLVGRVLVLTALSLAAAAAAPSIAVLALALALAGITSVVAQILVPFAATLAADDERGRVVGTVVSGLLIGILVSRSVSGLVAQAGGWRLVFALAAGLMLALAVLLGRVLPELEPSTDLAYGALLRSVATLVREERVLRRRMLYGVLSMGMFSVVWTSLAFLLAAPPYAFGDGTIGLFALFGLGGAAAAQGAGRIVDRGLARTATGAYALTMLAGWGLLALGRASIVALAAGLVVLDMGVQALQITNQGVVYALRADARSRINTAFMGSVFVGGAIGSAASAAAYDAGGWGAVCALGAGLGAVTVGVWAQELLAAR